MFDVFDHILPVVFPAANATQRGHDPGIGVHFCQQFLVLGREFLAVQTGQGESFDMGHSKFPYRGRTAIKYRRIMLHLNVQTGDRRVGTLLGSSRSA